MTKKITVKQRKNTEGRKRSLANLKPWPKGVSGNPAGRPKSITLSEACRALLAKPYPRDPEGRTFAEVIADKLIAAAVRGSIAAAKEIADRTEGKPSQALDVDMSVSDWREEVRRKGLTLEEVWEEARLIVQSAIAEREAELEREEAQKGILR